MRLATFLLVCCSLVVGLPAVQAAAGPTVYQNPLTTRDAPDPDVVASGGVYYAFTTGNTHVRIEEFQSENLVTWTELPPPGALVAEPWWASPGLEWAPSVAEFDGTWVMYYATYDVVVGTECVTEATASSVAGPYVNTSATPVVCGPGGDIDPDVFIDTGGAAYLVWRGPDAIWSQPLSADGQSLATNSQPSRLTERQQGWESTVENPEMVLADGLYYLFFSGGTWQGPSYAVGYALCAGPTGPCGQPSDRPILGTTASVVGPGGENVFQDGAGQWWMAYAAWTAGDVGYPFGARSLRMDPLCFTSGGQAGPGTPVVPGPTTTPQPLLQQCPSADPAPYRLVAADGGVFDFGGAGYYGSTAGQDIPAPIVGAATDAATGGYWEVGSDGTVYPFDAPVKGDLAGRPLASPVVGMTATPTGGGYWLVAADGGVFAFGAAAYLGSMGGHPLDRPIVGMAAMADGLGYWLVASDGGVFSFGDAPFRGSTGGERLNAPIVGLTPDGPGGYWLVASDGGVFAYGAAAFAGSAGATPLRQPVVDMVPG
ncbi:MAG: glycoside hydrolase family 43 protein [Acidimicrobiales bacterium]